jgi:lipoprotein NlpD
MGSKRIVGGVLGLCALSWLNGCATATDPAPVVARAIPQEQTELTSSMPVSLQGDSYRVRAGDTLYSIAWQLGEDYRTLAGWNNIPDPYLIYVNQELRIKPPAAGGPTRTTAAASAAVPAVAGASATSWTPIADAPRAEAPGVTTRKPAEPIVAKVDKPVQQTPIKKPATKPESKPESKPAKPAQSAPQPEQKVVAQRPETVSTAYAPKPSSSGWVWPTRGKTVSTFRSGDRLRQGVEIAGSLGQPVLASRAGKVVYSGSGLVGYGNLVIIKHDDDYLSAYAFNKKLTVEQGAQVRRGEQVAQMGQDKEGNVRLHFEIRKKGTPVDPQQYFR